MNLDRWAERVYSESDFGRGIATTAGGAAGLASYLHWNDWVIAAFVGIIIFPIVRILASACHSRWAQSQEQRYSKDQMKNLLDSLGHEERSVVQAFVWYGSTSITWREVNMSPIFTRAGIDSLVSRGLIDMSVTADGMTETFVLDAPLFEYAQSVLPNDPPREDLDDDIPF